MMDSPANPGLRRWPASTPAYAGPTRGREDILIYCNDKERMLRDLSRDVSHRSGLEHGTLKPQ